MAKGVKLSVKIALDVVMFFVLVLLYRAKVLTLTYHEVAGIGILLIFLLHCLFNRRWITNNAKKLFSPQTPARTKFSYWLSIALIVCFLIIIVSGIFISKVLFKEQIAALNIDTSVFRTLHMFFSAVSLILVGIHLGLYWDMVKGFFRKKFKVPETIAKPICYVLLAAIVAFGSYSVPTTNFSQWLLCPVIPIEHGHHGSASSEAAEASDSAALEQAHSAEATGTEHGNNGSHKTARNGQGESAEANPATADKQSSHSDRDATNAAETDKQADSATSGNAQEKKTAHSGNHGNNVEPSNVLLTIAQFGSIAGLFAAITYYISKALHRRKKTTK